MNKRRHEDCVPEISKLRFLDNSLENAVHRVVLDHPGHQKQAVKLILNSKTHILELFNILRIHATKVDFYSPC